MSSSMSSDPTRTTAWTRRQVLKHSACGFGYLAMLGLFSSDANANPVTNPLAPRAPHFPPRARRVLFLFMHGGISHVDSFDPKPKLTELNGQPLPIEKP